MHAWLKIHYKECLLLLLAFAFFTRIYNLHLPERYIFDEVYHAITAKLIARNDPRAYEWWNPPVEPDTAVDWLHPPLAKYTQAVGIKIFGENTVGWRISSVFFGVGVVFLVYALADALWRNKSLSLLAALLTSLDGLLLVQSRVAMNDIHVTFFILLALLWYWQYRQLSTFGNLFKTGVACGLAMASKWSGVYVVALLGIWELISICRLLVSEVGFPLKKANWWRKVVITSFCLVLVPVSVYLASYLHMYIQGKDWNHLVELHRQTWWYQTNLQATHAYQSRPWQWFLDLRPVWYHVDYHNNDGRISNIYAFGNPALFWLGGVAVVSTLVTTLWLFLKKPYHFLQKIPRDMQATLFVLGAYAIVWIPWQFSPRIMFFYHYTPAVPLLCIVLAKWLIKLASYTTNNSKLGNYIVGGCVVVIALTFIIFYPQWTGIAVPKNFADAIYFAIPSWK